MSLYRVILFFLINISFSAVASVWVLPDKGNTIGEIKQVTSQAHETLAEVGIRFNTGYDEMLKANPRIDPNRSLSSGTMVTIPSRYVLPAVSRRGIVINLAQYRLYYYPPDDNVVITMPVGIGRDGWNTPTGQTKVIAKERDPIWHPTAKLQDEAAKHGMPIPNAFPGGEGNPLGRHVLRLGWPTYLIHGTNRQDGVGTKVSAGCIRMSPEDIEMLYDLVKVGTPVTIINK